MPKDYAARKAARDFLAEQAPPKYEVRIRDLARFPIAKPPRRPKGWQKMPQRWLLLADAHFPFVDPATWQIVKWACRDLKPTGLVIMGDWLDFGSITRHEKTKESLDYSLLDEMAAGDDSLDELDEYATTAWFRKYLRGNHEWRLDRYLMGPACPKELRSLIPSVPVGLHLEERGYEYVQDKPETFGTDHLFIHGHYYSKHHAARHLESLWQSCVYGHTHVPQQFTHSAPLGAPERRVAVATGLPTMRDLLREWHEEARVHTWVNGFGVMEFTKDHSFAHNIYVIDGQAAYGGFSWDASRQVKQGTKRDARLQP